MESISAPELKSTTQRPISSVKRFPGLSTRNRNTGEARTFLADGSTSQSGRKSAPAIRCSASIVITAQPHTFELPERAVDGAMGLGHISPTLPYIKKKAMELLKVTYASNEEAVRTIPAKLAVFYRDSYPAISSQRSSDISQASAEIAAIYNRNVFPDLKVTWGTYPNNLGHTDFPGCFRCHDGSHSTADRKTTITQDCNTCHEPLAVEEASPGVLNTLGLASRICRHPEDIDEGTIEMKLKCLGHLKRIAALVAVVALSLTAAGKRYQYSPREKAAYADAATVDFVRPGLVLTVNGAQIAADGTITVVYTLTDPKGLPLDAAGVTTPGVISLNYIAAVLPNNQDGYTTYTTRVVSQSGGSATEPNSDSGGVNYQCRARAVSVRLPDQSAGRVRRGRHAYHRYLWGREYSRTSI